MLLLLPSDQQRIRPGWWLWIRSGCHVKRGVERAISLHTLELHPGARQQYQAPSMVCCPLHLNITQVVDGHRLHTGRTQAAHKLHTVWPHICCQQSWRMCCGLNHVSIKLPTHKLHWYMPRTHTSCTHKITCACSLRALWEEGPHRQLNHAFQTKLLRDPASTWRCLEHMAPQSWIGTYHHRDTIHEHASNHAQELILSRSDIYELIPAYVWSEDKGSRIHTRQYTLYEYVIMRSWQAM